MLVMALIKMGAAFFAGFFGCSVHGKGKIVAQFIHAHGPKFGFDFFRIFRPQQLDGIIAEKSVGGRNFGRCGFGTLGKGFLESAANFIFGQRLIDLW